MNKNVNNILLTTESKEIKYNKDKEYDHLGLFKTKEHKQYLFKK